MFTFEAPSVGPPQDWPETVLTLVDGTNNNVVIGNNRFFRVSGPTMAFAIHGLTGGTDGKRIWILNPTGQNMQIAYDSGTSTAANRIYTTTGAAVATTGNGFCELIYSSTDSRWWLMYLTA